MGGDRLRLLSSSSDGGLPIGEFLLLLSLILGHFRLVG